MSRNSQKQILLYLNQNIAISKLFMFSFIMLLTVLFISCSSEKNEATTKHLPPDSLMSAYKVKMQKATADVKARLTEALDDELSEEEKMNVMDELNLKYGTMNQEYKDLQKKCQPKISPEKWEVFSQEIKEITNEIGIAAVVFIEKNK